MATQPVSYRPLPFVLAVVCSLGLATAGLADKPVNQVVDARADGVIDVSIVSGSLTIRGWNRNEVKVEGTVGDDVEALEVEARGSRTEISLDVPKRMRGNVDINAELEIWVPMDSTIESSVVSASVDVDEVHGPVELASVSGTIDLTGAPAQVEVETVSGTVRFSGSTDTLQAESVSGRLELGGRAREVEVSSVSGRIDLETEDAEQIEVETISTSIELDVTLAPAARVTASTHSGSVILRLDSSTSARISASTFSGSIRIESR